jgi:glutamine cyclotransferase
MLIFGGEQKIAIINPETGQIRAYIDLTNLQSSPSSDPEAVLNGIAYDSEGQRLFVTGKLWPQLFEIQLVPSN